MDTNINSVPKKAAPPSPSTNGVSLTAEVQSMKLEEYLPTASSTDVTANLESLDATESITTQTSSFTGTGDDEKPGLTLVSPEACSTLRFEDHYEVQEKISKGSFGTVFVAKHKHSTEEFAVKVIERKKLSAREKNGVVREVSILRDCRDVEHIVRLIDFYASPKHFYVVQVYAQGGDLFKRLAQSSSYSEKDARDLASKLLQAMEVLHSRKIVHRDLKPENLLLRDLLHDTNILIADFGFARYVPREGLKTRCGTPAFVAPEVLVPNCRYDERIDMWSVGCLLYMLLGGYPPFQDKNHRGLFRKIRGADFCFHEAHWKNVSISAKQLIASLLVVDPRHRVSARTALQKSHWFKMSDAALKQHDLSASLGEIKMFNARRQLKGAIRAVMWTVRWKMKSSSDVEKCSNSLAGSANNSSKDVIRATNKSDNTILAKEKEATKFADLYELGAQIDTCQSGVSWECTHKYKREVYAVKVIERSQEKKKTVNGRSLTEAVLHEAAILDSLNHKHIVKFVDFFEEDDYFYLVTERMYGGDLFDRIIKKKRYTEKDARELGRVLLEAVNYLHQERVAHRDLKPQTLLLKTDGDDPDIKIADFGFACRVHTPQSLVTRCGTPTYVAPEILKNCPYDQSADMWSVGVILYVLLCGYPPFADETQAVLFQKVRMGDYKFSEKHWGQISDDAKELIKNLLVVNPSQRWTAKQALASKWLAADDKTFKGAADLSESVLTLKRRKVKLRSLAKGGMWGNNNVEQPPSKSVDAVETLLSRREDDDIITPKATMSAEDAQRFFV